MKHPRKSPKKKRPGKTHAAKPTDTILESSYQRIKAARKQLDEGTLTRAQFHTLLEKEQQRNEWASRVQLQSIARELIPIAASHARKGRSRLLAVVAGILLKTGMSDLAQTAATQGQEKILVHHVARPAWAPNPSDPVDTFAAKTIANDTATDDTEG